MISTQVRERMMKNDVVMMNEVVVMQDGGVMLREGEIPCFTITLQQQLLQHIA